MKRLIALLVLSGLLLTACAAPNENVDGVVDSTEPTQTETETAGTTSEDAANGEGEAASHLELSVTFQNLLDETNAAHESITAFTGDYTEYMVRYDGPDFAVTRYQQPSQQVSNDTVLTLEQLTEDMETYYTALRTSYGCYNYFGGDDAFRSAIDAVIADCAALETITCGDVRGSLQRNFAFVKDAHFSMGSARSNEFQFPFFYREIAYDKTESGYQTRDGKVVTGVDGYEDLDDLFKLSLTKEGELVYYPILLQSATYKSLMTEIQESDTVLTVRYSDGSFDELTADPYRLDYDTEGQANISVVENQGIPVVTANYFGWDAGANTFLNTAVDHQKSGLLVMDMRKNRGGNAEIVDAWFQNYTDQTVSPNALVLNRDSIEGQEVLYTQGEDFISMDNVRIILTGKYTASAGETFIDLAYNLENSLIVGENTMGCYRGANGGITLPNSGLSMRFGVLLNLFPDDAYFEEYRGFYPDIWVPQAEAEEAVMNFIARNATAPHE